MSTVFHLPSFSEGFANDVSFSAATLEFFETGGVSVNLATYTDNARLVAHAQPVVADSAGRWPAIYLELRSVRILWRRGRRRREQRHGE